MKNVDLKNEAPTFGNVLLCDVWVRADKPVREYPLGTKFKALMGGYWIRVERGFKWCTGSTFQMWEVIGLAKCVCQISHNVLQLKEVAD